MAHHQQHVFYQDVDKLVDNWEVSHNQPFPKAGSYYQGTKHNFFDNYEEYRADVRKKSVSFEIEAKLEQLKEEQEALPWEN